MKLPKLTRGSFAFVARPAHARVSSAGEFVPSGACGTGWNERWVPDRFGAADFTSACRAHDACYETCGSSKSGCDSRFRGDLQSACRRAYSSWWHAPQRGRCSVAAEGYALAVRRMGGDAYRAAQRAARC